jgi:DNA polymerase III sliding clamp (beta) subunit (PCNA family)
MILKNMNFTCDRNALIKEIIIAKEALFILVEIQIIAKIDTLLIKSTNGKDNFESKIPGTIKNDGSCTFRNNNFSDYISSFPEGEIEFIQYPPRIITISSLTRKFIVRLLCSFEFLE